MNVPASETFAEGAILALILGASTIVDLRRMIIPNAFNLTLAVTGLAFQAISGVADIVVQAAFAVFIFVVFFGVRYVHSQATGRIGLGLGDVKMMAAAACWVDPLLFPLLLLAASASALLAFGGYAIAGSGISARSRIPFGPFISLGLGCAWVFQQFSAW